MRKAEILFNNNVAGHLIQTDDGFVFEYNASYLKKKGAQAVSLTLPLQSKLYSSKIMFPFFDGLIPEGWLLDVAEKNWKIKTRDRMGLLLACCNDCIGAVSVKDLSD